MSPFGHDVRNTSMWCVSYCWQPVGLSSQKSSTMKRGWAHSGPQKNRAPSCGCRPVTGGSTFGGFDGRNFKGYANM